MKLHPFLAACSIASVCLSRIAAGGPVFTVDADMNVNGDRAPVAIRENLMVVGEPGFELTPQVNYSGIFAGLGSSLGLSEGTADAAAAIAASLKIIAELQDGLQETGAAHTFRRDGWNDRWTFADTFNHWDAAVRAISATPRFHDYEYGRFGAAVAFAGDWVLTGAPAVQTSPALTVLGGQDFWHEVGAVTFSRPGWTSGFQLTGHSIADTGSWMNLGSLVAGGEGFAAVTSGPKRTSLSTTTSSGTPGVLHLFKPQTGVHPWALARTFDYRDGSWQDSGGGYPDIHRLANAGPDLIMVRSSGNNSQVSVLKDVASHLAAGTVPPPVTLLQTPETGPRIGVASDGESLAIGVPSLNQILVYRRNGSGSWVASHTLHGAAGEQIGSVVGIGGRAVVSLTAPGGSVIAGWRELADGTYSRYASQDAGRALTSLSFHPESLALIGPVGDLTRIQSSNLTRSFRVAVKDAAGNPLPGSTFKILQINTAGFTGTGSRMTANVRRHLGPPRKIWVDMGYHADSGTLPGQTGKPFYYDLSGPDQNRNAPVAEHWFPFYRATHLFEGQPSSSFLFEADGGRIPDWSEGNRPNGYLINPRIHDATGNPVPAGLLVTDGAWNLTWSFSPENQARVNSATLNIETELSPYVGSGYMRGGQTVTTDAQGTVLIEGMEKGSYLLEMTGAYSGRSSVINLRDFIHDDEVRISASGQGAIRGTLAAETFGATGYGFALSNPLAGVTITVAGREVATDANGAFAVTGLPPGSYTVQIPPSHVISGGNTRIVTVSDSVPETSLWLREIPSGSHALTLKDGSGNALSGVEVLITGPFDYQRTLVSSSDGMVSLGALLAGSYEIRVQGNALPWGAAPFPLTVAGSSTQVTIQPRGQSRVVSFGPAMAGKNARFQVASSTHDATVTSEWVHVEPTDALLRARSYYTVQKNFRLPVNVTFAGPCEILSAEVGLAIDMVPVSSYGYHRLLEARPALGIEDPYQTIAAPVGRTWNRINRFNVEIYDQTTLSAPVGRKVPAATTETWNLLLDFDQPEVPGYLFNRIKTNATFSGPDTYLRLTLRSPDGLIREFSSPIGPDGQVTVSDLPAAGKLHARVDAPLLVPGTESALFDLTDSSEWIVRAREFGSVTGVCRFADGSGAAHVAISLQDENGAPLAAGETALDGSFRIERVPVGNHRIHASRKGYHFSPAYRDLDVTLGTTVADFSVRGAVTLPLHLVDADGNPDSSVRLALEPSEWRQELAAPVMRALNPQLSADAFLQAAVTVDEEFDLAKLRLYFEGGLGNYEPWEAGLVLAHPDGTRLVVQDQRLDYYSYWRLFANAWHEDSAAVPPVGYSGSRWSSSWQYGNDYSKRSLRPLDSFSNLTGRTSKGTWFIGLGPAVYDSSQAIDARIHRVILALSPRTPLQPQTAASAAGNASFEGLTPGPYRLLSREGSALPGGLSMMLRGGETVAALTMKTRAAAADGPWPLQALAGGRLVIDSPVRSDAPTSYRWFRNGVEIATTNAPSWLLENASSGDAGLYEVEASNAAWRIRAEAGSLAVRLDPQFTWNAPEFIVQGDEAAIYQNAASPVAGTITYNLTDLSNATAGVHEVTAIFTPTDGSSYATVAITRAIRVKLPVTLAWEPPTTLAGNAPDHIWQTATAPVPGSFSYTPHTITDLSGQTLPFTVTFTPDNALTYAAATLTRGIEVRPAAILTWNPPAQVPRTGTRTAIRCATANIPGTFSYDPQDLENASYGSHRVTLTFTPEDTATYEVQTRVASVFVSRFISNESLLRGVMRGGAAWADVNDDQRLDLLLSGEARPDNAGPTWYPTASYTGVALGGAAGLQPGSLFDVPNARYGILRWHDSNGDGLIDLFHGGMKETAGGQGGGTYLFRNNGGSFANLQDFFQSGAPGDYLAYATDARWGDYDHDGDADIVVQSNGETALYRNDSSTSTFARVLSWDLVGGKVAWQDLDGDSDLDLILCGNPRNGWQPVTKFLLNDGHGQLVETTAPFPGYSGGDMDFEDIDGDGDLDALFSSSWHGTHLFRNLGGAAFEEIPGALPSYQYGSVAFGDLDGDGDPDLVMNGTQGYWQFITRAFLNDGHGSFSELDEPLRGLYSGGIALADHDADGDLDWVMHGGYFNDPENDNQLRETTVLVDNSFAQPNVAPEPPSSLNASAVDGQRIRFSWPAASDAATPANSLRYNLAVWRHDGTYVLPPLSHMIDGTRMAPDRGNAGLNRFWELDLPDGSYHAAVQTIDAGLAASSFSQIVHFTVPLATTPYDAFLAAHPGLTGADAAPLADPDADGMPNLLEAFLGASSPTSSGGTVQTMILPSEAPAFVMIIPEGVSFGPGPRPSLIWSGHVIAVEGGLAPDRFITPVEAVSAPAGDGLPAVPQGFKRVAFRLEGAPSRGFFRFAVAPQS